jgi:hypothetical protein
MNLTEAYPKFDEIKTEIIIKNTVKRKTANLLEEAYKFVAAAIFCVSSTSSFMNHATAHSAVGPHRCQLPPCLCVSYV